ncbi:inorganic phosphate transporter [Brachybacterium kimchii]|uniref:Phosphate transporter n=1 Tax=Brachybacterium kimchii TaxID=2942909 RepID=A0ABY4ND66_9MICO|nr:inorganic phosphate transporter [Brachybacterium kimchii]UQN31474.1 inorganic phosphate transporter [Brachybacterium kimchii]
MTGDIVILALLIITAVAFDFTNGFHDTGNAMATSIATGALKPKTAVTLSAILNVVGGFLSVEVAVTVTTSVLKIQDSDTGALITGLDAETAMFIIFAGLVGGILWNLATWLFGIPSSSSHALFGGLIGAGLAALGTVGINWEGLMIKVIIPALLSPFIAGAIAASAAWLVFRVTANVREERREKGFRYGQIATASLVSLAHGTGDAQKTMGVIALGLIAHGTLSDQEIVDNGLPPWIIIVCAGAIALGTYMGGWRVIRTLGKGLVELDSPQGMAAEASSAAIILTSSHLGMALSTTHVATGSIVGSGVGRPGAQVRWGVAGRMAVGWLLTLPAAAVVGAITYFIGHLVGGVGGAFLVFAILLAVGGYIYYRSQLQKVDAANVNDDWEEGAEAVSLPGESSPVLETAGTTCGSSASSGATPKTPVATPSGGAGSAEEPAPTSHRKDS